MDEQTERMRAYLFNICQDDASRQKVRTMSAQELRRCFTELRYLQMMQYLANIGMPVPVVQTLSTGRAPVDAADTRRKVRERVTGPVDVLDVTLALWIGESMLGGCGDVTSVEPSTTTSTSAVTAKPEGTTSTG